MSDLREALLFLELDKAGDAAGPLFDEPRRLVRSDPHLRMGWFQFQALRALALECSPEPEEKMFKAALLSCRRQKVGRQLAQAAGNEDLAREILLGRAPKQRGAPTWALGLLLLGALGLGYLALGPSGAFFKRKPSLASPPAEGAASPVQSSGLPPDTSSGPVAGVPFEFPVLTPPAEAALAPPAVPAGQTDADDIHHESASYKEARVLVRRQLHSAESHAQAVGHGRPAKARKVPKAEKGPAVKPAVAAAAATPTPMAAPTAIPTALPPAPIVAAPAPTAAATAVVGSESAPANGELSLSSSSLSTAGGSLDVTVSLPEHKDIDLRLFDESGRSVRLLAQGAFGPGTQHFPLDAKNDQGGVLPPGTYYLRAMTPWYSRVETIQIQ